MSAHFQEGVADYLLLELAEVDEDDEVRVALIHEQCLAYLATVPPDATFAGRPRDDAIDLLKWAQRHMQTAGELRDRVRRLKGEIARGEFP